MRYAFNLAIAAILWVAIVPITAWAQVETGSILLKVADEQGAAIPGANSSITSAVLVGGRVNGVTDVGGVFRFTSLPPGTYVVQVELQSFQTLIHDNVVVSVGQTTPLDVVLKLATVAESVTVHGESPVVDTTSANVNVHLTQELLQATPGGRDIWSQLEYKMPGLTMNRPDVGGGSSGLQGSFSARGTDASQNTHFLNGINVGSPSAIGGSSLYYDFDAFEEIQVSTSAQDLSVSSSGVFMNMVTKSGTDQFRGQAGFSWAGSQLQSHNISSDLSQFGFASNAGAVDYIADGTIQAGGPILKNKLRVFGSARDFGVSVGVPGFSENDSTHIENGLVNLTYQVNGRNKLTGFVTRSYYQKPNRGAGALVTPQSDSKEQDSVGVYQGLWNSIFSDKAFLDLRVSYLDLYFPLFQKGSQQSLTDLSTGLLTLNAASTSISERKRLQTSANLSYYLDHALGGRHELRFGLDNQHAPASAEEDRVNDLTLAYRSLPTPTASTVTLFNTPVTSSQVVDVFALFAQDSYTVDRLTVTGGLRWERLTAGLPAQSSPPSQWFPNASRQFVAIPDVLHFKNAAPRISAAYDLSGSGKTAIKAAAGRYLYQVSTSTPNSVNANFSSSTTYAWSDLNHDLQFQPDERGTLLSRSGSLITSFDPNIQRPYTNEFMVGIDHELLPGVKLSSEFTIHQERNQMGTVDAGIPVNSYQIVTRPDLGPDGLAGTADDGVLSVYNQDPATLGQDHLLTTNTPLLNLLYRGIEFTLSKRFSNRWQLLTSYTYARSIADAVAVTNPNTLINSRGASLYDRPQTFKLTGSYMLPHDISVSGNVRLQSGPPVTRTETYALNQGNVTVNAQTPGSDRLDALKTLDARVSKTLRFGGRELELMADAYNLTNANTTWAVRALTGRVNVLEGGSPTGTLINQRQYLSPISILAPRILRLSVVFRF